VITNPSLASRTIIQGAGEIRKRFGTPTT